MQHNFYVYFLIKMPQNIAKPGKPTTRKVGIGWFHRIGKDVSYLQTKLPRGGLRTFDLDTTAV